MAGGEPKGVGDGASLVPGLPLRILARIEPDLNGGCWLWTGTMSGTGVQHAQTREPETQRKVYVHRHIYEHIHGPVAPELEFDHLCRVDACVRPEHVEPVPHVVNAHRGTAAPKSVCSIGHPKLPGRGCKVCDARRHREVRARKREATHSLESV